MMKKKGGGLLKILNMAKIVALYWLKKKLDSFLIQEEIIFTISKKYLKFKIIKI